MNDSENDIIFKDDGITITSKYIIFSNEGVEYSILLSSLKDVETASDWIAHMMKKSWFRDSERFLLCLVWAIVSQAK